MSRAKYDQLCFELLLVIMKLQLPKPGFSDSCVNLAQAYITYLKPFAAAFFLGFTTHNIFLPRVHFKQLGTQQQFVSSFFQSVLQICFQFVLHRKACYTTYFQFVLNRKAFTTTDFLFVSNRKALYRTYFQCVCTRKASYTTLFRVVLNRKTSYTTWFQFV